MRPSLVDTVLIKAEKYQEYLRWRFDQQRHRNQRHRLYIPVFFGEWSDRMLAFKRGLEIAAAVRHVKPGFLLAQLAYAALDQWGELPEAAVGCLEEYYKRGMKQGEKK